MAKKNEEEKTNVMRVLDQKKIAYRHYCYIHAGGDKGPVTNGVEVAAILGEDVRKVFKTLVTVGKSGQHYVFMIPVAEELDLKKAAAAVSEKSIAMIPQKDLLPLTGYVHGGCSPIGMKKTFPTTLHETAGHFDTIIFSAGKIGYQVELSAKDLEKIVRLKYADVITE
ncbi:MAG: Cys-tRNA(Pro) deacylase [Lachnospiraceae bacterium]|nr:Cys-tRNA(Pro) deacylase [Lachnospiraceae bacterium]